MDAAFCVLGQQSALWHAGPLPSAAAASLNTLCVCVCVFVQVVSSELASLGQSHNSLQATAAGLRQDLSNAQNLVRSSKHVLPHVLALLHHPKPAACGLPQRRADCAASCCVDMVSLLLMMMPAGARA